MVRHLRVIGPVYPKFTVRRSQTRHAVGSARGLREITRDQWDAILRAARCSILSTMTNERCDSYVLSESSLFVYSHKLVLKTCGTTTLLVCLEPLLEATAALGLKVEWVAYTRKDFTFPTAQKFPHRDPGEEVRAALRRGGPPRRARVLTAAPSPGPAPAGVVPEALLPDWLCAHARPDHGRPLARLRRRLRRPPDRRVRRPDSRREEERGRGPGLDPCSLSSSRCEECLTPPRYRSPADHDV